MAKFKIKEEAYIAYSQTTWQGEAEFEGETICYRYSEDDNGWDAFVLTEDGWSREHPFCAVIYACIGEWGNPEEFGKPGETVEIDDAFVEEHM